MTADVTLIDALLALAIVVIVPAAIPLHPAGNRTAAWTAAAAGLPAAAALAINQGIAAGLLVAPWLTATVVAAFYTVRWWWPHRKHVRAAVWAAAAAYLAVGAAWLLAERLALSPGGLAPPFIQLTAIHFHYAGFIATVLAGCAWRHQTNNRTAAAAALLTAAGPPTVAVGFVAYPPLQVAGALLLTAGLWLLAWVTIRHIALQARRAPAILLVLSSLATIVPMVLAVQWALGNNYATPALSIPAMVTTHGLTNALGFALLGTLGWRTRPHTDTHHP